MASFRFVEYHRTRFALYPRLLISWTKWVILLTTWTNVSNAYHSRFGLMSEKKWLRKRVLIPLLPIKLVSMFNSRVNCWSCVKWPKLTTCRGRWFNWQVSRGRSYCCKWQCQTRSGGNEDPRVITSSIQGHRQGIVSNTCTCRHPTLTPVFRYPLICLWLVA